MLSIDAKINDLEVLLCTRVSKHGVIYF